MLRLRTTPLFLSLLHLLLFLLFLLFLRAKAPLLPSFRLRWTPFAGQSFSVPGRGEGDEGGPGEGPWLPHLCPRPPGHWQGILHASARVLRRVSWTPPHNDTIFFLQTSCAASFTAREACAVESAARHHPRRPVQVLLTSPVVNTSHPLVQVVEGVGNVHLSWLDLDRVFGAPPLHRWHEARHWMTTSTDYLYNMAVMVSDAARLEVLRRYGGTYLDLDSITLKPLPQHTNYLARLLGDVITNGVMSFQPTHVLLQRMVGDIPDRWNVRKYTSIGADLLTHHLHLHCPHTFPSAPLTTPPQLMTCGDVTVLPGQLFFPFVNGQEGENMFVQDKGYGPKFVGSFRGYALHLYNHLTNKAPVDLSRESVVREVAVRHCPGVVKVLVQKGVYM